MIRKLLFVIVSIFFHFAFAQGDVKFERITTDIGLSEGFVNSILKDYQGFLWFGTRDGLNRYDGYSFKVYKYDYKNPKSISNNVAQIIYQTKDCTLVVGTHGGLNIYDRKNDAFKSYKYDSENPLSLSNNAVYALYEDSQGLLWVGTFGGGVCSFDRKTEKFTIYKNNSSDPTSLSGNAIRAIVEDNNGNLWIGADGAGLNKFNRSKKNFTHYRHNPSDNTSLGSDIVLCCNKDKKGFFWIGSWASGITKFDPNTGKAVAFFRKDENNPNTIASNENFKVIEASTGDMWICTRNGLNKMDTKTGKIFHYQHDPLVQSSLNFNVLCEVYEDSDGILWIGTEGGGAAMLDLYKKPFEHIKNNYKNSNSLSSNDVTAILQDKQGEYWIATRNGLNIMNFETGKVQRIFHTPGSSNTLIGNLLSSLMLDNQDNIWLGSSDQGLSKLNIASGKFENFTQDDKVPFPLSNSSVYSILKDRHDNIWISTYGGGVNMLKPNSKDFKIYTIDSKNNMQNVGLCLYEDTDGDIWCGTVGHGIVKVDKKTDKLEFFETDPTRNSISNNMVYDILEAYDYLWICTGGSGIDRFDKVSGEFKNYNKSHGLPADQALSILSDEKGHLWIATSKGLSRFNVEKETFRNFDVLDGLQGNNFNAGAAFVNSKGEMFFGGKGGLTKFTPQKIMDNNKLPLIVITDFKIFNQSLEPTENGILKSQITLTRKIEIPYNKNNFSFEFAALHFSSPTKNRYFYMMEGYDQDWIETDHSRRFAAYTNLPNGKYTFRVKASNNDNVWNEAGVAVEIVIKPAFWQTLWFYGICIIVIIVLVILLIKLREKAALKEKKRLEEQVKIAVDEVEKQKKEIIEQNIALQTQNELEAKRQWANEGMAKFAEILSNNKSSVKMLAQACLSQLIKYTNGVQGGLFILNQDDETEKYLQLECSYAYNAEKLEENRIEIGQGLVGNCFVERKTKRFESMPDNYLFLSSGLGQSAPHLLILVPLQFDEIVIGVIEIAYMEVIEDYKIQFIEKIAESICSQLYTTLISQKTNKLLEKSQQLTETYEMKERHYSEEINALHFQLEEVEVEKENMEKKLAYYNAACFEFFISNKGKFVSANSFFYRFFDVNERYFNKKQVSDFIFDTNQIPLNLNDFEDFTSRILLIKINDISCNCLVKITQTVNEDYVVIALPHQENKSKTSND